MTEDMFTGFVTFGFGIILSWIYNIVRMMYATLNGRNELIYEAREMSVTGNGVQKSINNAYSQIEANMDQGSGDTPDYSMDNHREPYAAEDKSYTNPEPVMIESRLYETRSSAPMYERLPSVTTRYDADRISQSVHSEDDFFRGKQTDFFHRSSENLNHSSSDGGGGIRNSTLAIVENQQQQPSFTSRESNPAIPSPNEHSKTTTLRISDRARSDNEDAIEKADDSEQDKSVMRHDSGLKTSATTNENIPDFEKSEKNGNWQENPANEADSDCAVQCLYYTIECCECTIL